MGYLGVHLYRTGEALDFSLSQWLSGPGIIAVLMFLIIYLPKRYEQRVFEPLPGRFTLGRRTYVFSADGIDVASDHNSSHYDWSAIVDVAEEADYFYLFIDTTAAFIIPKRIFESDEIVNQFKNIVAESVPA